MGYRIDVHLVFIGKIYDKVEAMKAAPSQQATLDGLWKKKVPKKERGETKAPPTEISSIKEEQLPESATPTDSTAMDMDAQSSRPPESSLACKIRFTQSGGLCS